VICAVFYVWFIALTPCFKLTSFFIHWFLLFLLLLVPWLEWSVSIRVMVLMLEWLVSMRVMVLMLDELLQLPAANQWCGLRPSVLRQDRSETRKLGLGLAGLVLCCETRSCHTRRHNDLEGHSSFSSTTYSSSILCLEHHYCGDQQWRSPTYKLNPPSAFGLPVVLVLLFWSWSWSYEFDIVCMTAAKLKEVCSSFTLITRSDTMFVEAS